MVCNVICRYFCDVPARGVPEISRIGDSARGINVTGENTLKRNVSALCDSLSRESKTTDSAKKVYDTNGKMFAVAVLHGVEGAL